MDTWDIAHYLINGSDLGYEEDNNFSSEHSELASTAANKSLSILNSMPAISEQSVVETSVPISLSLIGHRGSRL